MSSLEAVNWENELHNSGEADEMLMSRVQMGMDDAKVSHGEYKIFS
jgi:hypothetical protein